jgi:hypothetical protein
MVLSDVLKIVDRFSKEDLRQLREYIEGREQEQEVIAPTFDLQALLSGLEEMRAGITEAEFHEIERAMNEEYVEPLDESA